MTIHVVVGPPCSGKSTFVQTNAPEGAPRWDFDHVASTVAGMATSHDIPAPVRELVLAMRRGLMGYVLDAETQIEELWIIHASPSPTTIQRLAAIGAVFHLLDPGMEECLARAQRENRPEFTEDAIRAWYDNPPELPEEKGEDMKNLVKSFGVKAEAFNEETGEFTGYASVFDVVDSYGDVVRKGAFTETLKEWAESSRTIPVLYGHDFRDPFSNIGGVTSAVEDDHGLKITARLDMDNPKAAQVHRLLKEGRLSEMSFAYYVREAAWDTVDEQEVYELRDLKLLEVSVVPIGANPATSITDVKAFLSTAVKQADGTERDALAAALEALDTKSDEDDNPNHPASGRANAIRAHIAFMEATK